MCFVAIGPLVGTDAPRGRPLPCLIQFALQRAPPRSSAGSQAKRGAPGSGRGKADTGHKGSKSGKAGKKGMKRSASFAFGPADGEPGMRRRSVNVSARLHDVSQPG